MRNSTYESLSEFLERIETQTLIISSHHWPRGIDRTFGGKMSQLTIFDLNIEAAGIYTLHQISAAVDTLGCKEIALVGHFPGRLTASQSEPDSSGTAILGRLAGRRNIAQNDGFAVFSGKLVQAAVYLQVQFRYLKYFLDQYKWKVKEQKPLLHAMLLDEDQAVFRLEELESQNEAIPINYVLN
jgi:hypothetical protein